MTTGGSPGRGVKLFLPVPLPDVIDVTRTGRRAADLRTCLIFLLLVAGGSDDMVSSARVVTSLIDPRWHRRVTLTPAKDLRVTRISLAAVGVKWVLPS